MRLKEFIDALADRHSMKWRHNGHGNLRSAEGHCPINAVAGGNPDPHNFKEDARRIGLNPALARCISLVADDWLHPNTRVNGKVVHDRSNTDELRRLLLLATGVREKDPKLRKTGA